MRPAPLAALVLLLGGAAHAGDGWFPLRVGNWWAYEELDADGAALSRETWTVVEPEPTDRAGEFHVRSMTKRLDLIDRASGHRWEGHEYLRDTAEGVQKRYPAGRDREVEVTVLKAPRAAGTRWRDAQGECEATARGSCAGPRGELSDCAVVSCRLGDPTVTVVTSTYARGVGMVRQEIDVVQFLPALHGSEAVLLPCDSAKGGHSVLRLTAFHVGR